MFSEETGQFVKWEMAFKIVTVLHDIGSLYTCIDKNVLNCSIDMSSLHVNMYSMSVHSRFIKCTQNYVMFYKWLFSLL